MFDFQVAICTFNRADHLDRCLEGLFACSGSHLLEVLVIDNGSTDKTPHVVSTYNAKLSISYVFEPEVGLSCARNRALKHAQKKYIVYLDDDAIPDQCWLSAIDAGILKYNPDLFGGPYYPLYLSTKRPWYLDDFGSAHYDLKEGDIDPTVCFSGGNMGWRVSLLKRLGGFDTRLGMMGGIVRLGEETMLQIKLRDSPSLRRVFFSQMSMSHYVSCNKMTLTYIANRSFCYGRELHLINPCDTLLVHSTLRTVISQMRFGLPLLQKLIFRDRHQYPFWKTYAAKYLALHMISVGVLWTKFLHLQKDLLAFL